MKKFGVLIGLIACLFLASCGGNSAEIDTYFASPEYGVHTSFWWETAAVDRDLDRVNELGFGWVKQIVAWRDVENNYERGAYDWYRLEQVIIPRVEEAGLKLLVRIDRPPIWAYDGEGAVSPNGPPAKLEYFGEFCTQIATKFKGRIQAYQIWNEPNLHREWNKKQPDPVAYTALLKECSTAIKAADPDAIIISAGLAPTATDDATAMPDSKFLRGMYEAGAADYFDVLGLNAPGFKAPPDVAPAEVQELGYADYREYTFRHVEDMRDIMIEFDDDRRR